MRILDNVLLSALAYVGSMGLSAKDVESSTETYRESLIKEEAELNCGIKRLKLEIDRALERFGELGDDDILKKAATYSNEGLRVLLLGSCQKLFKDA